MDQDRTFLCQAERLVDNNPDSAFSILTTISYDKLSHNCDKALYGLLYTQALDKMHQSIPSDSMIAFAVDYFGEANDLRRCMVANNYKGNVHYMQENYSEALVSYIKANELAKDLGDDFWIGMSARGIADIYCNTFNSSDGLRYATEEYGHLKKSGRQPYLNYALLDLSHANCSAGNYPEAISIAHQAMDSATQYHDDYLYYSALQLIGISHLGMDEPDKSLPVFQTLCNSSYAEPTDSMHLAISYAAVGKPQKAIDEIGKITTIDSLRSSFVKYIVFKKLGHYEESLRELEIVDSLSNAAFRNRMSQNLIGSMVNYFNLSKRYTATQLQTTRLKMWLTIIVALVIASFLATILVAAHNRHRKETERKVLFAEHLQEMLHDSRQANSKATSTIKDLLAAKYELLEELCMVVVSSNNSNTAKQRIASLVTTLIDDLSIRSEKVIELEKSVDAMYDNLYSDFRKDLPTMKDADYRLYLFCILGFSSTAISLFLNENKVSAIYDRKRRLKDKIKRLDSPKRDRYLAYLS